MITKIFTFLTALMTILSLFLTSMQAYQYYLEAEEDSYSTEYIYDK